MFEVGRDYTFTMLLDGTQTIFTDEVAEVELPLIKLRSRYDSDTIINTSSAAFVSAKIQPYRSPAEKEEARAEFEGLTATIVKISESGEA